MFNPALISGLVAVGGTWLFCTAVLRGGERQKEARDVKLAAIEKNMHAFYQQLRLTKKKIKTWSIIPTSQVKYYAEMDQIIFQQLLQDTPNLSRELLISRFRISDHSDRGTH